MAHHWSLYSNADGTVQFIELKAYDGGQQFVRNHRITSSQGTTTRSFTIPSDLPGDTASTMMDGDPYGMGGYYGSGDDDIQVVFDRHAGIRGARRRHAGLRRSERLSLHHQRHRELGRRRGCLQLCGAAHRWQPLAETGRLDQRQFTAEFCRRIRNRDRRRAPQLRGPVAEDPLRVRIGLGPEPHAPGQYAFRDVVHLRPGRQRHVARHVRRARASKGLFRKLFRTTGPGFSATPFTSIPFPDNYTNVGTLSLSFTDANTGTMSYTVNGVTQTKPIARLIYALPAPTCTLGGTPGAAPNYSDLWWRSPAGSENGWGVNIVHQADILFATWFTYEASGSAMAPAKGMWLVMSSGSKTAPGVYTGELQRTTGPAFSAVPFNPDAGGAQPGGKRDLHLHGRGQRDLQLHGERRDAVEADHAPHLLQPDDRVPVIICSRSCRDLRRRRAPRRASRRCALDARRDSASPSFSRRKALVV